MAVLASLIKADKSLGKAKVAQAERNVTARRYSDDPIEHVNDAISLASDYIDTVLLRVDMAKKAQSLLLDAKAQIEKGDLQKALVTTRQIWKLTRNRDEIFNGWSMGSVANNSLAAVYDLEGSLETHIG